MKLLRDRAEIKVEKKKRKYESRNPFQLLIPTETRVEPTPVASYEICYGCPAVTTQVFARATEEAICTISRFTQIPLNLVTIYCRSVEHHGTHEKIEKLSPHSLNIVTSKDNIFSPLSLFPGISRSVSQDTSLFLAGY